MCNSCEMLAINGVNCHELGCPNRYQQPTVCAWCGASFMPESRWQKCCEHTCEVAYSGAACDCDQCIGITV